MPQLLIRNLDEQTITRLKERAKSHNRSLQGEVKLLLETCASRPDDESPFAIAERWQGYFSGRTFSDSADLAREDRSRERIINIHLERLPEGYYLATSDEMQGLVAQGRTITETMEIARDVARRLLEAQQERRQTDVPSRLNDSFDLPLVVSS